MNYYNEFDAAAADWLEELIKQKLIPDGVVDRRSIVDVEPADLRGFPQCHFFAGIGGWPFALRLAGVGDDEPLWTGSCPCQPFSAAGRRKGTLDDRHLAPELLRLIAACRPKRIYGEQVASKDGRRWLSGVQDLRRKFSFDQFLSELEGASPGILHRVREVARTRPEIDDYGSTIRDVSWLAENEPRCGSLQRGEESSEGAGVGFRPLPERDSKNHRRRGVSADRASFSIGRAESVELALSAPPRPFGRIHQAEYASRSVCAQRDGEYLGRHDDPICGGGPSEEAGGAERRASTSDRSEPQETAIDGEFSLRASLEALGYAVGAADLCAAGVGAPHIRQRLFWVADRCFAGLEGLGGHGDRSDEPRRLDAQPARPVAESGDAGWVADGASQRRDGRQDPAGAGGRRGAKDGGAVCGLADAHGGQRDGGPDDDELLVLGPASRRVEGDGVVAGGGGGGGPDTAHGGWSPADWIFCRDGKWRPVESSVLGLVDGVSDGVVSGSHPLAQTAEARTARLRGYGNAIVPQLAAEFIRATR